MIETNPPVNTCRRSLRLSSPNRITAKLTPRLTSGIIRFAHWLVIWVMPTLSTSSSAWVRKGRIKRLSSLEEKLLTAKITVLPASFL